MPNEEELERILETNLEDMTIEEIAEMEIEECKECMLNP